MGSGEVDDDRRRRAGGRTPARPRTGERLHAGRNRRCLASKPRRPVTDQQTPAASPPVEPSRPRPVEPPKTAQPKPAEPPPPRTPEPSQPKQPAPAPPRPAAPLSAKHGSRRRSAPAAAGRDRRLDRPREALRDTGAIGVFTKLALKNEVDDLLERFRTFHTGRGGSARKASRELRPPGSQGGVAPAGQRPAARSRHLHVARSAVESSGRSGQVQDSRLRLDARIRLEESNEPLHEGLARRCCWAIALVARPSPAAEDPAVLKDLTAVIALQGQPCGQVVSAAKQGDNDYIRVLPGWKPLPCVRQGGSGRGAEAVRAGREGARTGAQRSVSLVPVAPLAQVDRASDYESEGQRFESSRAHHINPRRRTEKGRTA